MAMKSLNKAQLIGNLTRDPELRYTPQGTAVVSFSVATNRQWNDSHGQQKDEATFHRVVAWAKLAEIIGQYVKKGARVFVEGRLSTKKWTDKQNVEHMVTEIVADDLIILSSKNDGGQARQEQTVDVPDEPEPAPEPEPEEPDYV